MMKKILLLIICALPLAGRAQITAVGLTAGVYSAMSPSYIFQAGSYSIIFDGMGRGLQYIIQDQNVRLQFGAFAEHGLLSRFSINHQVNLYHFYPGYYIMGSPTGDKSTGAGVFSVKYNPMLRVYARKGFRFEAGAALDFNFVRNSGQGGDLQYKDDNLNVLFPALQDTFNPLVLYAAVGLAYRAGPIEMAFKYNHGVTPITNSLDYQGQNYPIPVRMRTFFLHIGILVFNKDLKESKKSK